MKRWTMVMSLAVLVLLGALAGYPSNSGVANSPEGKIAFLRLEEILPDESEGDMAPANAWVVGIDGKNPTKITSSRWVDAARWLNSETVAVVSEGDIWLVQITKEGKKAKATRLTSFEDVGVVSCSPEGEWLFFTRDTLLCKIRKDGKGYQVLKSDIAVAGLAIALISVSREQIFYTSSSGLDEYWTDLISVIDYEGRNERLLYKAPDKHEISALTSSKDGQRIIFLIEDAEHGKVFLKEMDAQSLKERTLIKGKSSFEEGLFPGCSFMPGEKAVLYNDGYDLFILDLTEIGNEPKLLISNALDPDVWYSEVSELGFKVMEFPDGLVGRRYSFPIEPVNGVPPYKTSLVSGALPPGLTVNDRTGGIEGEPTQAGNWKLTLRVVDAGGKKGTFSGVIQVWRILTLGEHGTFKGFDGLQMALNMALDMDQIRIEKGTYVGSGVIVPQNKAWDHGIRISGGWNEGFSEKDDNPEATILDGNKAKSCVLTLANAKGEVALENLTFRNSLGGAVRAERAEKQPFVSFTNCTFVANPTVGYGGGGAVSGSGAFTNCTFIDNGSTAVRCGAQSSFTNCTFTRNSDGAVSGGGTFTNCTFTKNSASFGGAVSGRGAFTNCTFTGNSATQAGSVDGDGTFTNCAFTDNSAAYGGAVNGDGTFTNCTFTGNSAAEGGAVRGSGAFTNCTFTKNSAAFSGGAVMGAGAFTNCTFTNNVASRTGRWADWYSEEGGQGGAVNSSGYEPSIFKTCVFNGNSARTAGAVMGWGIIISCVFANNSAEEIGGAFAGQVWPYHTDVGSFINCVFYGNKAGTEGGGITGEVKLLNCIFYKNTAAGKDSDVAATGSTEIDYSLITYIAGAADVGPHNIMTSEPRFSDPGNGDFTLQPGSPCINAGKIISEPVPVPPCQRYVHSCHRGWIIPESIPVGPLDLAGKPRVVAGKIDMGAYEWQGK